MLRDLDRVVSEAVTMASARGRALAALTIAVRDPARAVEAEARRLLERAGASGAELHLVDGEGPVRLVAVELGVR